jgi:hypothetical protein
MKRSSGPRKTVNLSKSVQQHLNMYALAASASGVSLLALAQPSDAKIIYTRSHIVIGSHSQYRLDLNQDGITDFTIKNHTLVSVVTFATLSAIPAQRQNGIIGAQRGRNFYAYALVRGARIGPKQPFRTYYSMWMAYTGSGAQGGQWINVTNRYLGLEFLIRGKVHYGWARLNVTVGHSKITATLTGYAYETIPGKSIIAGRTKGPDDSSVEQPDGRRPSASLTNPILDKPQPASLGMLAFGAQGISLWRRKESVGATQ